MIDTDAATAPTGGLGSSAGYAAAKREMSGAVGRDDGDLDALVRESFGWTSLNFHSGFDQAIRLAKEARDERDRLNDQWSDAARLAAEANAENAALRARVEALAWAARTVVNARDAGADCYDVQDEVAQLEKVLDKPQAPDSR